MNNELVVLIDGRNTVTGGIDSLNTYLCSLQSQLGLRIQRASLKDALRHQFTTRRDGAPRILIVDYASSLKRIPAFLLLRLSCWINRILKGLAQTLILREHHYSENFVSLKVSSPGRFRLMLKLAYACFDKVVVVSEAQLRWLHASHLKSPAHSEASIHCTNLAPLLALDLPKPSSPVVFGAIGRFCYQKGFDDLITAWKRLAPEGARLLVAGYGEDAPRLHLLAQDCPSIEILGPCKPADFFARCHWSVIPSRYEPFGQVCLESKAAGRPVVVTDVDGLPEQVRVGNIGMTCDRASLGSDMQSAIELTQTNPALYEEMSREARQSAKLCFDGYPARFLNLLQRPTP